MSVKFIVKLLTISGLLKLARFIKKKFTYVDIAFKPYTPPLLIAICRSFRWCLERRLVKNSDYLEFGVSRGFGLWFAQALARDMAIQGMRFFGFDSFRGLPSIGGIDSSSKFKKGDYCCPRKVVETYLTQYGVDWSKTFLVEGWFKHTLKPKTRNRYGLRKCSICVMDCDLYESTRLALEFIEPLIRHQTILLFDDWNSLDGNPNKGEKRAFFEFLARNPHIEAEPFVEFGNGKGYILNFTYITK